WRSADSKARGGARTLPQRQVRRKLSSRFHLQRRRGIDLAMTGGRQDDAKVAGGTKTRRERLEEAMRANLAKRKAQKKARRKAATTKGNDRQKPTGDTE